MKDFQVQLQDVGSQLKSMQEKMDDILDKLEKDNEYETSRGEEEEDEVDNSPHILLALQEEEKWSGNVSELYRLPRNSPALQGFFAFKVVIASKARNKHFITPALSAFRSLNMKSGERTWPPSAGNLSPERRRARPTR